MYYDRVLSVCKKKNKNKSSNMLTNLVRLQQVCNGVYGESKESSLLENESSGAVRKQDDDDLDKAMHRLSMNETADNKATCHGSSGVDSLEKLMNGLQLDNSSKGTCTSRGSKIEAVVTVVKHILIPGSQALNESFFFNKKTYSQENYQNSLNKIVVMSCWTSVLDEISSSLELNSIASERIDGTVSVKKREEIIKVFSDFAKDKDTVGPKVLLATIGSCNCGINLTACNHLLLVEPSWNPMTELQAMDRVSVAFAG